MGNRGNYGVLLMLGRLSPIPCGQTPPSPQIGRAATIPQNGPPAPTGRHEPPKSHSKCRHPAHKRRSRREFGSIHAPSGALRRGPSTLGQTSATDGPGAGRRRERRAEGCGRLRPGTGPGGEGILPSHAPQGALGRGWLKAMRAWRRERGQDALAPRARRHCEGALGASNASLGGGRLALHRGDRRAFVRALKRTCLLRRLPRRR